MSDTAKYIVQCRQRADEPIVCRIALVGESVARRSMYDPHFNCAMALQRILDKAAGPDCVEVVDLAKKWVDMVFGEIHSLIAYPANVEDSQEI